MSELKKFRFTAAHFSELHGHEVPWNDETNDCDVFRRDEYAALIANNVLDAHLAALPAEEATNPSTAPESE